MEISEPLSVSSVNKHIIRIGAFLKWAMKRGYVVANYAEGLTIAKRDSKEEEEREAYSHENLLSLIESPLYASGDGVKDHPERYWIPLIGLFSGMRLNEICQLHLEDIREEGGLLCFDINKKGDKELKTASSKRLIPVHQVLLGLGLKEYVDALGKNGESRLWPPLKKKRDGYGMDFGKWFERFNRKYVTDNPKRSFHSFRHTLANNLKQGKVDTSIISEILGHSRSAAGEWDIVVSASLPKDIYRPIGNAYDLVVLDLPREDSPIAAIRDVRAVHGSGPLVITTTTGSEELAVHCFRLGVLDYFRKPIAAEEFRYRVWDILRAGGVPKGRPAIPGGSGFLRAVGFIVRNCDHRILLAQAAREAGMSVSCFARTFRREMEETFIPYVNKLRVGKAIRFLEEGDLSMSEIAFECGFTNQYHFTRTFKKLAGTPPREFRKRLREWGREDRAASLPPLVTMFNMK